MTDGTVRYEVSNGIARITLNRPPVNALDLDMVRSVVSAFETAGKDDKVRAVVLASAVPNRFCAGLDLGGYGAAPGSEDLDRVGTTSPPRPTSRRSSPGCVRCPSR